MSFGIFASFLIIKIFFRYEKCPSTVGLASERQARAKELQRQEYEIDLSSEDLNSTPYGDDDCSSIPETPNTFYSRPTSVKNTPRPQSLISSSSTVRPPLASDEDDFSDGGGDGGDEDEDEHGCRTPKATECGGPLSASGIPPIDSTGREDGSSVNGADSRNSWMYMDSSSASTSNMVDQCFNTFGSKAKSLFDLQNSQSDAHIGGILEGNAYAPFFDKLPVYYSSREVGDGQSLISLENIQKVPVFSLYSLQYDDEQIECRPTVPPPADVTRYRLQVRCLSLKMELSIEPIFASMAIYDARERRKVTESFYFDMNQG